MGEKLSLALAVKLVNGAGTSEKMWREAAGGGKKERYGYSDDKIRNKDQIRALPQVSVAQAAAAADRASRYASALREAVAIGNSTTVEVDEKEIGFDIPKGLLD